MFLLQTELFSQRQQAGTAPRGAGVSLVCSCVYKEAVRLGLALLLQLLTAVPTLEAPRPDAEPPRNSGGVEVKPVLDSPVLFIT